MMPSIAHADIPLKAKQLIDTVKEKTKIIDNVYSLNEVEQNEILCTALNLYHEARGEDDFHQWAVVNVVANRVKHRLFPSSFCGVIWDKGQFTWTRRALEVNLPRERKSWIESQRKAYQVFTGKRTDDPTKGATHFYQSRLNPKWATRLVDKVRIGVHVFARMP